MLITIAMALAMAASPHGAQAAPPNLSIVPSPPPSREPGTREYRVIGPWHIQFDESLGRGCFLYRVYDDNIILRAGFSPVTGTYALQVFDPPWPGLDRKRFYGMLVQFDGGATTWKGAAWSDVLPTNVGVDTPGLILMTLQDKLLRDIGTHRTVSLRIRDHDTGPLSLDGSRAAVDALFKCQKQLGVPVDPATAKPSPREDIAVYAEQLPSPPDQDPFAP